MTRLGLAALAMACLAAAPTHAGLLVPDDRGGTLELARPAKRIISLAPHITELLFAAGAGDRVVGVDEYSYFPEPARRIPRVGNSEQINLEQVMALQPDLVVAWLGGGGQRQLDALHRAGIPVLYSDPRRLEDVARSLRQVGAAAGTGATAEAAARAYSERLSGLRARHAGRPKVTVMFQIWEKPLLSVNGRHIISDALELCGGRNVFAALPQLTPEVSMEAVMAADPEVIGATFSDPAAGRIDNWRRWPQLLAVRRGNLFALDPDLIARQSPRILDGVEQVCAQLDAARARRAK